VALLAENLIHFNGVDNFAGTQNPRLKVHLHLHYSSKLLL
jgi:hypothetical protein